MAWSLTDYQRLFALTSVPAVVGAVLNKPANRVIVAVSCGTVGATAALLQKYANDAYAEKAAKLNNNDN